MPICEIWSNSRFKLCLKVQNEADRRELLHSGDAANIANIKAGELPDTSFLDNMSTIDGNKARINSYDEKKESLV